MADSKLVDCSFANPNSMPMGAVCSSTLMKDHGVTASYIQSRGSAVHVEDRLLHWRNNSQQLFILLDGASAPYSDQLPPQYFSFNGKAKLSGGQLIGESIHKSLEKLVEIHGGLGELLAHLNENLREDLEDQNLGNLLQGELPVAVGGAVMFSQCTEGHSIEICSWGDSFIGVELTDGEILVTPNYRAKQEAAILKRIAELRGDLQKSRSTQASFWNDFAPELVELRNSEYNKETWVLNGNPLFGDNISNQTMAFLPGTVRRVVMVTDGAMDFEQTTTPEGLKNFFREILQSSTDVSPLEGLRQRLISKSGALPLHTGKQEASAWLIQLTQ